jgi:hypothetical protein
MQHMGVDPGPPHQATAQTGATGKGDKMFVCVCVCLDVWPTVFGVS